jgi:hypothetical protein
MSAGVCSALALSPLIVAAIWYVCFGPGPLR